MEHIIVPEEKLLRVALAGVPVTGPGASPVGFTRTPHRHSRSQASGTQDSSSLYLAFFLQVLSPSPLAPF